MEIPSNLDAWYENHGGPVVLVVQPRQGVSGQSSIVHMLTQPYAMLFASRDAAREYHDQNAENFKRCKMVACYPVLEKKSVERESNE